MEEYKITISMSEYNELRDAKTRAESAAYVLKRIPYNSEVHRMIDVAITILNGGEPDVP